MQGAPASPSTGQHRRRSWIPRYPHRTPAGGRRLLNASGTSGSAPHSAVTDGASVNGARNAVAVRTGARAGAGAREYVVGRAIAMAAATTTSPPASDVRAVRL